MKQLLHDVNIVSKTLLDTPRYIKELLPLSDSALKTIVEGREAIENILEGKDERFMVVVGPCSIHCHDLAVEYASRLKKLSEKVSDNLLIVMRVYFEKPRTSVGWKGYINDPHLDDSFQINEGLKQARKLLLELAELGLPAGTEALDPVVPQYLQDLIAWTAIGARTTQSQTHREMASGISTPVGLKNGTDGSIEIAVNGLHSVARPHRFLGINQNGQSAIFHTKGNPFAHIILRGGKAPNYDKDHVSVCERILLDAGLPSRIMIDCSHGNSGKDHKKQAAVFDDVLSQRLDGNKSIIGVMIESNINEGKQSLGDKPEDLDYGVSITDACISWEETETLLLEANKKLASN